MRKLWYIPWTEFEGEGLRTPWAAKEYRRRRRKNKLARQSRKRNRG